MADDLGVRVEGKDEYELEEATHHSRRPVSARARSLIARA